MTEKDPKVFSRRQLLGGVGKLAYVAPALTVLSLSTSTSAAIPYPVVPMKPRPAVHPGVRLAAHEQHPPGAGAGPLQTIGNRYLPIKKQ